VSDITIQLSKDEAETLARWAYNHGVANGWTGTTGKVASILVRIRGKIDLPETEAATGRNPKAGTGNDRREDAESMPGSPKNTIDLTMDETFQPYENGKLVVRFEYDAEEGDAGDRWTPPTPPYFEVTGAKVVRNGYLSHEMFLSHYIKGTDVFETIREANDELDRIVEAAVSERDEAMREAFEENQYDDYRNGGRE
jgi:hypothetical protein